ncbi:MAG: hypothetical protein NTZ90_12010 [Proteobacteria bacterium]|nr:hypothetical protein [Pseudomonadota bacterium]
MSLESGQRHGWYQFHFGKSRATDTYPPSLSIMMPLTPANILIIAIILDPLRT